MSNQYLSLLWDYPDMPQVLQSRIEQQFEEYKYAAMCGDEFAGYAVFVLDLVCHRREANVSVAEMDSIINSYDYPEEFAARLTSELESKLLKRRN